MKVGTRSHYGVRAMVELARVHGGTPLSLTEIAAREGLSIPYLEQLVIPLRRAGLVEGSRGVHGGYRLTKEPSSITVGEIVRALEGPVEIVACASEVIDPACCEKEPFCPSKLLWQRVHASIASVLDSTTLADLCHSGALS